MTPTVSDVVTEAPGSAFVLRSVGIKIAAAASGTALEDPTADPGIPDAVAAGLSPRNCSDRASTDMAAEAGAPVWPAPESSLPSEMPVALKAAAGGGIADACSEEPSPMPASNSPSSSAEKVSSASATAGRAAGEGCWCGVREMAAFNKRRPQRFAQRPGIRMRIITPSATPEPLRFAVERPLE